MGLKPERWRLTPLHKYRVYWCLPSGIGAVSDMLKYDTSWDWLMPVVEKIATIKNVKIEILPQFKNNGGVFRIHIDIPDGTDKTTDFTINRSLSIKAVHLAVVEFIRWYNNTQNP